METSNDLVNELLIRPNERINEKLEYQKRIANYISKQIKDDIQDIRVVPILDTFLVEGFDVGITFNTVKDVNTGYAVVAGGTKPVRMQYNYDGQWSYAEKRVKRTFLEWLSRKDISDMGDIVVECRPQGIVLRKNDHNLISLCEKVAGFTLQELKLNYR